MPYPRGFTPALRHELHLREHLVPGLPTLCGCCALLLVRPFVREAGYERMCAPLRPTMASADFSLRRDSFPRRRPFRREARSPQVRTMAFPAQSPDLRHLSLGRESFAVSGPLALLGTASYPVSVRRLAGSLHRFVQRFGRPRHLAVRLDRYDQLSEGLSPPSHRPGWAHYRNGRGRYRPRP